MQHRTCSTPQPPRLVWERNPKPEPTSSLTSYSPSHPTHTHTPPDGDGDNSQNSVSASCGTLTRPFEPNHQARCDGGGWVGIHPPVHGECMYRQYDSPIHPVLDILACLSSMSARSPAHDECIHPTLRALQSLAPVAAVLQTALREKHTPRPPAHRVAE